MCLLTPNPIFFQGNDCQPIHMLLHRFMKVPIPGRADAIVAYELADFDVHKHLVKLGEPGFCPPWPEINDIMYCKQALGSTLRVEIVVIREVILPRFLRDGEASEEMDVDDEVEQYTGEVMINILEPSQQNRAPGSFQVVRGRAPIKCSWACLLGHVEDKGIVVATDRHLNIPMAWEGITVIPNYRRGMVQY
jgi:hypothetical protein